MWVMACQVLELIYNKTQAAVDWRCLSGCLDTAPSGGVSAASAWPEGDVWSAEASYGHALALEGYLLAVGAPKGLDNEGFVDIFTATGPLQIQTAKASSRMSAWTHVEALSHNGSIGFGTTLVLKQGILAVAALGI